MITSKNKKMKTVISIIIIFAGCVLAGCTTSEKFTVTGTPGTMVYSPKREHIGSIGSNGKLSVKVPSDAYYGYLYTHDQTSDLWIPFALDVKTKRHTGTKAAMFGGMTLTGIGVVPLLTGTIMAISAGDDEDLSRQGGLFAGVGAALAFGGAGIGYAASERLGQLSYQYNFGYKKSQSTNQDMQFVQYVPPAAEPAASPRFAKEDDKKLTASTSSDKKLKRKPSKKGKKPSSKAKISLQNVVDKVVGNYDGSGVVSSGGQPVSNFENIEIRIVRIDVDMAGVQIYYDGEPMFAGEEIYSVVRKKDGSFVLNHEEVAGATITVTSNGRLDYRHPAVVFDDGEEYLLTVKAARPVR